MGKKCILTTALMFFLIASVLQGCSGSSEDGPAAVVRGFYEAAFNNDTRTNEEAEKLAQEIKAKYFMVGAKEVEEMIDLRLPLIIIRTSKHGGASIDLSGVEYKTVLREEDYAKVSMKGTTVSRFPGGKEHKKEVDAIYELYKKDGVWKMMGLKY